MAGKSPSTEQENRLIRAIRASPLLIFTVIALYGLDLSGIAPQVEEMRETGIYVYKGNGFPIRSTLFGSSDFPNKLIGLLATVFTQMISGFDEITYWQTFSFITEYAGMYTIMLFESARYSIKMPMHWYVSATMIA
jgi:hypothetical protein